MPFFSQIIKKGCKEGTFANFFKFYQKKYPAYDTPLLPAASVVLRRLGL